MKSFDSAFLSQGLWDKKKEDKINKRNKTGSCNSFLVQIQAAATHYQQAIYEQHTEHYSALWLCTGESHSFLTFHVARDCQTYCLHWKYVLHIYLHGISRETSQHVLNNGQAVVTSMSKYLASFMEMMLLVLHLWHRLTDWRAGNHVTSCASNAMCSTSICSMVFSCREMLGSLPHLKTKCHQY